MRLPAHIHSKTPHFPFKIQSNRNKYQHLREQHYMLCFLLDSPHRARYFHHCDASNPEPTASHSAKITTPDFAPRALSQRQHDDPQQM